MMKLGIKFLQQEESQNKKLRNYQIFVNIIKKTHSYFGTIQEFISIMYVKYIFKVQLLHLKVQKLHFRRASNNKHIKSKSESNTRRNSNSNW